MIVVIMLCIMMNLGCTKEYLNKKPDKSLVVPQKLKDLQALLDNGNELISQTSYLTHLADGDFDVTASRLNRMQNVLKNSYLWEPDIFEGLLSYDWNIPYQQIFYANVVLETLESITRNASNEIEYNQIKGSAYFIRAYALFELVQQFASPFQKGSANNLLGVPIRTNTDLKIKVKRNTIAENYHAIIQDINSSIPLLPEKGEPKSRPSKGAAFALLARTYLNMADYEKSYKAASDALKIQNELIDYNHINASAVAPFPDGRKLYNKEIIYYTDRQPSSFYNLADVKVSNELLKQYHSHDLRKRIFYRENGNFKGTYSGHTLVPFTGLATNEMYFIRSESYARLGKIEEALVDLNTVMIKRWSDKTGEEFVPFNDSSEEDIIQLILAERRKELVTRGLRWNDLRRLNLDPRFAVTLTRTHEEETYTLLPNDKRYVFPIPQDEIDGTGIQQNER